MPSPTSQPSPWPAFLTIGLLLTTINIAAILSAALAWCIAGQFRWIVALTGAFGNITPGLLFTTLLFVWLHKRKALFFISLGLLFVVQTITTITCTEFMLQRGAPIAPIDVLNGLDAGFLNSQLGVLTSSHVGPYLALSIAVFALSLSLLHRQWIPIPRQGILIVLAVLGTFILLSLGIHRTDRGKHALRPYDRLLGALVTTNHLNIIVGLEPALKKQNVTDSSALPALAMIGLPIQHCPDGLHVAEPITQSSKNTLVYNRLYELGIHLGGRGRPLSLLFIMLESVGAEDIACLDAGAPHGLTPYLDDLIQRTPHVLVGKRFHQGGQRTAGAMSSLLCGVGTGPFGIAPLRDLPGLKLRCWPDLVAEAGGDLRFFYADNLRFDRYDETLLEHGFRYLHTPRTQGRARGAWGLSDQELFADVLADLAQTSAGITPLRYSPGYARGPSGSLSGPRTQKHTRQRETRSLDDRSLPGSCSIPLHPRFHASRRKKWTHRRGDDGGRPHQRCRNDHQSPSTKSNSSHMGISIRYRCSTGHFGTTRTRCPWLVTK